MDRPDYSFYVVCESQFLEGSDSLAYDAEIAAIEAMSASKNVNGTSGIGALRVTPVNALGSCRYAGGWINHLLMESRVWRGGWNTTPPLLIGDDDRVYDFGITPAAPNNPGDPIRSARQLRVRVRSSELHASPQPLQAWTGGFGHDLNLLDWLNMADVYTGTYWPDDVNWGGVLYWEQGAVVRATYQYEWQDLQFSNRTAQARELLREGARDSLGAASGALQVFHKTYSRSGWGNDNALEPNDGIVRFADGEVRYFWLNRFEGYA